MDAMAEMIMTQFQSITERDIIYRLIKEVRSGSAEGKGIRYGKSQEKAFHAEGTVCVKPLRCQKSLCVEGIQGKLGQGEVWQGKVAEGSLGRLCWYKKQFKFCPE